MPIVGVNNPQHVLYMSKILVQIYTTGKTIHQFTICYMINLSFNFKKIFKTQVENCLVYSFSIRTMETIGNFLMNKNTSVMVLIMIDENNVEISKTVYRVLSCVFNTLTENYVCIEYLSFRSKTISDILS